MSLERRVNSDRRESCIEIEESVKYIEIGERGTFMYIGEKGLPLGVL